MSFQTRWLLVAVSGSCDVRPHALHAQAPLRPPARFSVAMAYDSARDRLVVFGGFSSGGNSGETWEWDGAAWRRASQTGPSPRNGAEMAYDEERQQVLLFGGGTSNSAPLGVRWRQLDVAGPAPRDHVAMGYDAERRLIVAHGGNDGLEQYDPASETWTFDGQSWKQVNDAGPRRLYSRIAFNTRSKALLLYGGFDREPSNELYEWDGAGWREPQR